MEKKMSHPSHLSYCHRGVRLERDSLIYHIVTEVLG